VPTSSCRLVTSVATAAATCGVAARSTLVSDSSAARDVFQCCSRRPASSAFLPGIGNPSRLSACLSSTTFQAASSVGVGPFIFTTPIASTESLCSTVGTVRCWVAVSLRAQALLLKPCRRVCLCSSRGQPCRRPGQCRRPAESPPEKNSGGLGRKSSGALLCCSDAARREEHQHLPEERRAH
jgi:hypothetical protein